jgi:DNA-binding transcriptional LysR family regulator
MTERGKRVEAVLSRTVKTNATANLESAWGSETHGPEVDEARARSTQPPLASLRAFEVIGRLGSIRKAALALRVDHAGVSRHLRDLESWAGTALMDRRRGELGTLTPEGMRYHTRIAAALTEIDRAGAELLRIGNKSRVDVTCTHCLCRWLVRHLDEFRDAHPDIELSLKPFDDSLAQIRLVPDWERRSTLKGAHIVELLRPSFIPVASPAFLASMPPADTFEDLLKWPFILDDDERPRDDWFAHLGVRAVGQPKSIMRWNPLLIMEAAKRGQGLTLAHHFTADDDLRSGDIVEVLVGGKLCPRVELATYIFEVSDEKWLDPGFATFRNWLTEAMRLAMKNSSIATD